MRRIAGGLVVLLGLARVVACVSDPSANNPEAGTPDTGISETSVPPDAPLDPSCTNNAKDPGESDVDCGGKCAKCATDKLCGAATDCQSGVCGPNGRCSAPTCTDTVQNGTETDVDCGGGCPACLYGLGCSVTADCVGGRCLDKKCNADPVGRWQVITTKSLPTGRDAPAVAYDPGRGTVVFGGLLPQGFSAETFVYQDGGWSVPALSGGPPGARGLAALIYDSQRKTLVLVGPSAFFGAPDTWELSGSTWSQKAEAGTVAPWSALAFESSLNKVIAVDCFGNVQAWDGNAWTPISSAGPHPPKNFGMSMAFDSKRNKLMVFGGTSDFQNPDGSSSDMYSLTMGTTWTKVATNGGPGPRTNAAMVYDPFRDRVILIGGESYDYGLAAYGDTWEWDGAEWRKTADRMTAPDNPTNGTSAHIAAFDLQRRRTVLYSSRTIGWFDNTTLEYYVLGVPCGATTDCASGTSCVDHVCCATSSCSGGDVCNSKGSPGTCAKP